MSVVSVVVVIGIGQIDQLFVIFVENRFRHDIFLCRPNSQIPVAAPLAAKREIGVLLGIRRSLTNWATMLHRKIPVRARGRPLRSQTASGDIRNLIPTPAKALRLKFASNVLLEASAKSATGCRGSALAESPPRARSDRRHPSW